MTEQLQPSIVRILSPEGAIAGAGFLVGDRQVLTCAHVVASALSVAGDVPTAPSDEVRLDFPFIAASAALRARVIVWKPVVVGGAPRGNHAEDIAVLGLVDDPPKESQVARLVACDGIVGHTFRTFGFPAGIDKGVWATGVVQGEQSGGWLQIEDTRSTGYFVEPGFSGAPVWDEQTDGVVGMVVAAARRREVRTGFIQPTSHLVEAWSALAQRTIPPCPYRGLFAFREEDAELFFGRDAFTGALADDVAHRSLVTVIGPSGSGKSSVVFAGLVHRLRPDPTWLIASFSPGDRPFRAAAATFASLLEPQMSEVVRLDTINKLALLLAKGHVTLLEVIERILAKHPPARLLLLVVDQLEELFTLCRSKEEQQAFLDLILGGLHCTARGTAPPLVVVATLRADFLGHALSYRPLADALQRSAQQFLGPMTQDELRAAIEGPAKKLNVSLEEGLTDRILEAVGDEPGILPLVEFALTALWSLQHQGKLTHAAYEQIGGVTKALSNHAEEVFDRLSDDEQRRARRIFVQLVQPGEQSVGTRRVATREQIGEERWELITRLADARLVVTGRREDEGTVELVHEALIREWERLNEWMKIDRSFRLWQEELRRACERWKAAGRKEDALLWGALLTEATRWLQERGADLSRSEREYIQASIALQQREQEAERERQQRESEIVRRLDEREKQRTDAEQAVRELERERLRERLSSALRLSMLAACVILLVLVLRQAHVLEHTELSVYDGFLNQEPRTVPHNVVLVEANQSSFEMLNLLSAHRPASYWFARAIDSLRNADAKAIGLSYPYASLQTGEGELASAIRRAGNVVLPVTIVPKIASAGVNYLGLQGPDGALMRSSAALGADNLAGDWDGDVRAIDLWQAGPFGKQYPAFVLRLAGIALDRAPRAVAQGLPRHMLISYVAGESSSAFGTAHGPIDFVSLAHGDYTPGNLRHIFGGKIVLIIQAPGAQSRGTPSGLMQDGWIQANALSTILNRDPIRPAGTIANVLVICLVTALTVGAAWRFGLWWSSAATILLAAFSLLVVFELFQQLRIYAEVVAPGVAILLAFAGAMALRFAVADRQRRRFQSIFGQYVKPGMIEALANAPQEETALTGARRPITALSVSIPGFTSLSKQVGPEDVVAVVDCYLAEVTESVHRWDGTIAKYVGDELTAIWNAPAYQSEHPLMAISSALDMIGRMEQVNRGLQEKLLPQITYRIGISSGDAIVGQMGTRFRQQYDVVGEPVTFAGQLSHHARGGDVLLGESTWRLIGDRLDCVPLEIPIVTEEGRSERAFRLIRLYEERPAVVSGRRADDVAAVT